MLTTAAASDRITNLQASHGRSLLRLLVRLTHGERQTAEDLVQETLLRAWLHVDDLPTETERERRWLFTVARRLVIDTMRSRRVRPVETPMQELIWLKSTDSAEAVVATDAMRHAYRNLSPAHQTILTSLYVEGWTTSEAAKRLGVPTGTVKSRAHYALRALRTAMTTAD